eukprot:3028219-Amphidinium_carterae.2
MQRPVNPIPDKHLDTTNVPTKVRHIPANLNNDLRPCQAISVNIPLVRTPRAIQVRAFNCSSSGTFCQ